MMLATLKDGNEVFLKSEVAFMEVQSGVHTDTIQTLLCITQHEFHALFCFLRFWV